MKKIQLTEKEREDLDLLIEVVKDELSFSNDDLSTNYWKRHLTFLQNLKEKYFE